MQNICSDPKIFWCIQKLQDVPGNSNWLSSQELAVLEKMRFTKRRADWLLGRWSAKLAISHCLGDSAQKVGLSELEIKAAEDGAPQAFLKEKSAPVTLSISHSSGVGFCVVGPEQITLGCDLELIEPRSERFIRDYFTAEEQATVAGASNEHRALIANLIWSAKESALKALRMGLKADTRSVSVSLQEKKFLGDWRPLSVSQPESNRTFHGWWKIWDEFVLTFVAYPAPGIPIPAHNSL